MERLRIRTWVRRIGLRGAMTFVGFSIAAAMIGCGMQPTAPRPIPTAGHIQLTASATPDTGEAPLLVTFNGAAVDSGATIASYQWLFGDGVGSNRLNVSHQYSATGNYTATLVATDDAGGSASATVKVYVMGLANQAPVATASASPTSGTLPLVVTFVGDGADGDGTIASYAWEFGDGAKSTTRSPTHTYTAAGTYTAQLTVTDNQGATGSSPVIIMVSALSNKSPTATVSATPTRGIMPLTVAFTGAGRDSDGTIASYAWAFGDGSVSNAQNPGYTYTMAGTHTAQLTVTDNQGATGSASIIIVTTMPLNKSPIATVSATPTSGLVPLVVSFTGAGRDSDGTITSYAWAFGDGTTSTVMSPPHTYTSAGSYTAQLTVTDNVGATGSATLTIVVTAPANRAPTATVSASPSAGTTPLVVAFTGAGSDADGIITAYSWVFGDGSTSSLQSPSHTYLAAGGYVAQLTVTDNQGAIGSASANISASAPVNLPPAATAAASPASGTAPLIVAFSGAGSDADGTIAGYSWAFGDGTTSSLQSPSHTYSTVGAFTARLTVADNLGSTGSATVSVTVTGAGNQAPTATASATPASGTAPLAVTFGGTGADADGTIASYAWTFGDGATSAVQNPTHTYTAAGTYSAQLTVTDNQGASGSSSATIVVSAPINRAPTATASATPTTGNAPLAVMFTGAGTDPDGTIASYSWVFGDGSTSGAQSPSHTYVTAGTYTARLTVTDNQGATGSASVSIAASVPPNKAPTATASATPTTGAAPLAVVFTGSGTDTDGSIAGYGWAFGDGTTSSLQNPSHTYASAGSYAAQLTVTDNLGATGTATVNISVSVPANQAPTATVIATPISGSAPLAVTFTGTGADADGTIAGYSWAFGDGTTSTLQNPPHTYAAAGTYTAQLTVTDNLGATGSATATIVVTAQSNRAPVASAGADQLNKDPGTLIPLTGAGSSDPDGSIVSYTWTQIAGTVVTMTGANTVSPTFTSPTRVSASYTFRLLVTDNGSPVMTGADTVVVSTRVTYNNTTGALLLSRGNQPTGKQLGCTAAGCHDGTNGLSPLSTYAQVFSARTSVKSKISPGASMLQYLLTGEAQIIIDWINNGAPQLN